jgi:hypothetical protein
MNFKNYKRLFAFGCSFTNYKWPMWPEILGHVIPEYYNYGEAASDNQTIFYKILEADAVHKFNEQDLIIVMWTTFWRDSSFHPNKKFFRRRVEIENLSFRQINFVYRDLNLMKASANFLKHKNVNYDFLSISGYSIELMTQYHTYENSSQDLLDLKELYENYNEVLQEFKPSMFELIYNCDWSVPPSDIKFSKAVYGDNLSNDNHPTPLMSFRYLEKIYSNLSFDKPVLDFVMHYENIVADKIILERIHPRREFQTIMHQTSLTYD